MDANFRTIREAVLSSPTTWVEVSKVFSAAQQQIKNPSDDGGSPCSRCRRRVIASSAETVIPWP